MSKIKYPKKFKGEKTPLMFPVYIEGAYHCSLLLKDGTTKKQSFTGHHTEDSCWVCCRAHNNRVGYSKEEVKQILKKYGFWKKGKDKKEKVQKDKKSKKGKKTKKGKKHKARD